MVLVIWGIGYGVVGISLNGVVMVVVLFLIMFVVMVWNVIIVSWW